MWQGTVLPHPFKIMKKISVLDWIVLVLFIVWISDLDMSNLTFIQEVGIGAVVVYFILLVVKVIKS